MTPGELLDLAISIAGETNVDVDVVRVRSEFSTVFYRHEVILRLWRNRGREVEEVSRGFTLQALEDARPQDVAVGIQNAALLWGSERR